MSKPRICKSCRWLHNRAEPCWSCQRWGRGKTDYYVSAEETLREYLKRKEQKEMGVMTTNEIIKNLELCSNSTHPDSCTKCTFASAKNCYKHLFVATIKHIKSLEQELIDERERYARLVSFELAEAELLRAAKGFVGACVNRVFFTDQANESEKISVFQLLKADCTSPEQKDTSSTADAVPLPLKGKTNEGCAEVVATSSTADERDDTVRRCAEYVAEKHLQMDEEPPGKRKPKVICISGKAQHGKDTTAQFIKEYLEEHGKSVLVMHYSDLLKFIVRTYFGWNGEKDEAGRALLQYVGTDRIIRQSPDYWTDFAVGLVRMFPDEWDYVILADCRFPNEVECFKNSEFDTCHVRVIRAPFASPLTPEQQLHTSETALDAIGADRYLLNTGTLEEYKQTVVAWMEYRAAINRGW